MDKIQCVLLYPISASTTISIYHHIYMLYCSRKLNHFASNIKAAFFIHAAPKTQWFAIMADIHAWRDLTGMSHRFSTLGYNRNILTSVPIHHLHTAASAAAALLWYSLLLGYDTTPRWALLHILRRSAGSFWGHNVTITKATILSRPDPLVYSG